MNKLLGWITVLALLCSLFVLGTVSAAAEDEPVIGSWRLTDDGQFLYSDKIVSGMIQFVYIGDGTDVTVPATLNGNPVEKVWLANDVIWEPGEQENPYIEKARTAAQRYLNITFEEGPTTVWVMPNIAPAYLRANSVTLPKSVVGANLDVEGATQISVPEGSALRSIRIENVLENVENPQPTTIDLTRATGLKWVNISRLDYGGECFLEGSVLKLPTEFKDVPLQRFDPWIGNDTPYLFIDYGSMPLAIQYADGSERSIPYTWQETEDGQFIYRFTSPTEVTVLYMGDETDVTVPAVFGGVLAEHVGLTSADESLDADPREQAQAWRAKAGAAAERYLNLTFSEGTYSIGAAPYGSSTVLRVASVTLPQSARNVRLNVAGLTALSVPQESDLGTLYLYNRLEGVPDPQPTTIDLTGVKRLWRLNIGRDDYSGDCFLPGSVLKLPTAFKDVPLQRGNPKNTLTYFCVAADPMPLLIQYADGTERPVTFPGDANRDNSVDMKDVLLIRKFIASMKAYVNQTAADFNGDGSVDMKDVLLIRRVIAVGISDQ